MEKNHYKYTEEQVHLAYSTSVVDLARAYGHELKDEGKVYRVCGNQGLFLFKNGVGYCCHATGDKGNGIDFLMKYCGCDSKIEAITAVLNYSGIYADVYSDFKPKQQIEKKQSAYEQREPMAPLPEKADNFNRIYWYLLNKRGLEKDIVNKQINDGKVYQESGRGNCVFVGYDENHIPKYCGRRGTGEQQYRGELSGSDKSYPFHIEGKADSSKLVVTESPIDAMSYATLLKMHNKPWQDYHIIALGGLSSKGIDWFLQHHPEIKTITFATDNDFYKYSSKINGFFNPGQDAAKRLYDTYQDKGYRCMIHKPQLKDFNEDLCIRRTLGSRYSAQLMLSIRSQCMQTAQSVADNYFSQEHSDLTGTQIEKGLQPQIDSAVKETMNNAINAAISAEVPMEVEL